MKVTLDLDKLLEDGSITQAEYDKLRNLSAQATGSAAVNILIGFGVLAVSGGMLALVPAPGTAILLGFVLLAAGLLLLRQELALGEVLANVSILVGALLFGGGTVALCHGSVTSFLAVAVVFSAAGVMANSALLVVLAVLALSTSLGASTGYAHAMYFLGIRAPVYTIALFGVLGVGLYQLSKRLPNRYERLAVVASRTCLFLVNLGFWVGSLWGDKDVFGSLSVSDAVLALLWALALIGTAAWAWISNKRWVLNTVAVFGGIHFYSQWFERLGASPGTVLVAGLLAIGFAFGIRSVNQIMKDKERGFPDDWADLGA